MKKIWLIRRDDEAVSPVIATILMVAITVVLAAVLYVMVSGLIAPPGGGEPTLGMGTPTLQSTGTYKFDVDAVSRPETLANYKVGVLNGTTVSIVATTVVSGQIGTGGGLTLSFTDVNGDGKLTGGDFFVVSGLASGRTYTLQLFWTSSGNRIAQKSVNT